MDLVRCYIIPFLDIRDRYLVVVDTDAIHPFLFLGDMDHGNQGLARGFDAGLREVRGRERYLQRLIDGERLCQRNVVERGQFFRVDVV